MNNIFQLCSDPLAPKSIKFLKDQMRRAALHCPGENLFGAIKGIKNFFFLNTT